MSRIIKDFSINSIEFIIHCKRRFLFFVCFIKALHDLRAETVLDMFRHHAAYLINEDALSITIGTPKENDRAK